MKRKRKIAVVVASRANYARVKSVMRRIEEHPDLELIVIVSASALLWRYGQVDTILKQDGFPIHARIYCVVEGENLVTMAKSTGMMICELATVFENLRPDVVVTVADRHETIANAIAASYMNIPVAHVQGGEVTGSIDEPVRHAITKLSHLHFPATKKSGERVVGMGEDPASVFVTGCPSLDLLAGRELKLTSGILEPYGITRADLDPGQPYLLVLQHAVTTEYGSALDQVEHTLQAVHDTGMQTIWLWPNVDAGSDDISKGLRVYRTNHPGTKIRFHLNFSPEDYACLLANAACIVGNSSSGIREGAFLGTPCVNVGTRQNERERGRNVIDVPVFDAAAIGAAIARQLKHGKYASDPLYGDGRAGERIVKVLAEAPLDVQKSFHDRDAGR